MEYRMLGKTGLKISVVGFGAIKLGGISQELTNRIIDQAIDGGMNYIDTARVYGSSEVRLGEALKGKREKVIISSKSLGRTLAKFKSDFETTMKNLRTDYLDILFAHDVSTRESWEDVQKNGIIDYMYKLKESGRIRHIAMSTHDIEIGTQMMNTDLFEAAMLAYNPANPETETNLIPLAKAKNMGVIIMKPFGGGVLTEERSRKLGFSITAEEALRFSASHPDITTVIPGLDKPEYVDLALNVGNTNRLLSEQERQDIISKVSIRGKNYCRGCGYCMPCVRNIPIPKVLELFNRWEVYGNVDWSQMHVIADEYTQTVPKDAGPDSCIACNACSRRCPYNLPIAELMKSAAKSLYRL